MPHSKKFLVSLLVSIILITLSISFQAVPTKASTSFAFIVLSNYSSTVDIGSEFYILAISSNGKQPTWKSSDSKVASVNTYGKVTAKKFGTALITAKIKNAEASCVVTVNKTEISISNASASIERGDTLSLSATTSNASPVTWKSSKKSIATIDANGIVTGIKPGETIITASADGSNITCNVIVKSPTITLSKTKISLSRGQTQKLTATVSSAVSPVWKSNKKSVALVDQYGNITAVKHGTATITATVDGVSKTCEVVVEQPVITLSSMELSLKKGDTAALTANVSSGNLPVWSSSNPNIIIVNATGTITAIQKGKAYVYVSEDGIKVRCIIHVTE